jgi:hypothetical protein
MPASPPATALGGPSPLPDPFDNDISPWLLRRLDLATALSSQLRDDAARILQSLDHPEIILTTTATATLKGPLER